MSRGDVRADKRASRSSARKQAQIGPSVTTPCDCLCHDGGARRGDVHPGERCLCHRARAALAP